MQFPLIICENLFPTIENVWRDLICQIWQQIRVLSNWWMLLHQICFRTILWWWGLLICILSQFYPVFPSLSHEIPLNINASFCIFRWALWWSGSCSSHLLTLDSPRPRVRNCGCTYIYLIIISAYLPDIWLYSFQTVRK